MRRRSITRGTIESTLALLTFHLWLATLDGLDPRLATQGAVFGSFLASMWLAWRAMGSSYIAKVVALVVLVAPSSLIESYTPGQDDRFLGCPVVATGAFCATSLALILVAKWNRVRARSLIWSLTHAQLVVIAILLGVLIAISAVHQFDSVYVRKLSVGLPTDAQFAVRVVAGVLPILVVLASAALFLLPLLLPPAFLFAWIAARGMTRRVEELLAVESMARARRGLFARVSHELKNPLAALRSAVEGIRARGAVMPEVEVLDVGVGRLLRLVGDLTELARAEVGPLELQIEDVDLKRSIESVVSAERVRAQAEQIALQVEIDGSTPPRRLDRVRFEQVLTNLVQNALKHVEAGGIVRVRAFAEQNGAIVIVEDTGSGIDAKTLPRVFEPGFSGDGGLGLGLAIASELATRMGGTLVVETPVGLGARFVLRI